MKTIEYRYTLPDLAAARENWGPGPWDDEPDKIQWLDETTGLPCLIVRNRMGALCGYVGVSGDHPLYEQEGMDEFHVDGAAVAVDAYGAISFTGFCAPHEPGDEAHSICHVVEEGEDDRVWWIGFDCGHIYDAIPAMLAYERDNDWINPAFGKFPERIYRDRAWVEDEVRALALQLAALA